jgi:hypothetical protein
LDLVYLYSHRCLLVAASRDGALLRNNFCCCNRKSLYSVSVAIYSVALYWGFVCILVET